MTEFGFTVDAVLEAVETSFSADDLPRNQWSRSRGAIVGPLP